MSAAVGRPATVVVGWLHIDCGHRARDGAWLRYPTAEYRCLLCGAVIPASGDAVPAFTTTVRAAHRATCPYHRKDTTP